MAATSVLGTINPGDINPGEHLVDGLTIQVALQDQQSSYGLTAHAGGAALLATKLSVGLNELATVATNADSAILPPAVAGLWVTVINDGAANAAIFPQQANPNNAANAADTIVPIGGGTAASSTLNSNAIVTFYCYKPGYWKATV